MELRNAIVSRASKVSDDHVTHFVKLFLDFVHRLGVIKTTTIQKLVLLSSRLQNT